MAWSAIVPTNINICGAVLTREQAGRLKSEFDAILKDPMRPGQIVTLSGGESIHTYRPPRWPCSYCDTKNLRGVTRCESCGAPDEGE